MALKELCHHIIIQKQINDFYSSITQEQIDEIHTKGKLTPLEIVQQWESLKLCIPANRGIMEKDRCICFNQNCHDCLMECASHKLEYKPIKELKLY